MADSSSDQQLPLGVAAYMLRLSYGQLLRLVQQRRIAGERRGGHWYTSAAAVRAFEQEQEREPQPAGVEPAA
jgi:hypothetical protein